MYTVVHSSRRKGQPYSYYYYTTTLLLLLLHYYYYTLAGAKVNLAARLMQAAGKMVADESSSVVLTERETYTPAAGMAA